MISYKPLWKLLIDREMNKTELRLQAGISANTITRMGKGEEVSLSVLNKICAAMNVGYNDIIEYIPEQNSDSGKEDNLC